MTTDQYISQIDQRLKALQDTKPFYETAIEVNRMQSRRIFIDGQDANGAPIGEYTGGPMYINPKSGNTPRQFPTGGKTGKKKFKNGKALKTRYFPTYDAFKKEIGRAKGNRVTLELMGNLRRAFFNGVNPAAIKGGIITVQQVIRTGADNPQKKITAILEKYPTTFRFSKDERAYAVSELKKIALKTMQGGK